MTTDLLLPFEIIKSNEQQNVLIYEHSHSAERTGPDHRGDAKVAGRLPGFLPGGVRGLVVAAHPL
jgi:hypothetical protein